jgi:hypothetical protein
MESLSTNSIMRFVCPYGEPHDAYDVRAGIPPFLNTTLWQRATDAPLLKRDNYKSAVEQFKAVCVANSFFQTVDVDDFSTTTDQNKKTYPPELKGSCPSHMFPPGYYIHDLLQNKILYKPELFIRSVQEIDTPTKDLRPHAHGYLCPVWIRYNPATPPPDQDSAPSDVVSHYLGLREKITSNGHMETTISQITGMNNLGEINKVVCFGLGHVPDDRSFLQHATVVNIVGHFRQQYGPGVTLTIHDEDYSFAWKEILKEAFGLYSDKDHTDYADKHTALLDVDAHTFVICTSPKDAISQTVIDLCAERGGPAALLRRRVIDDGRPVVDAVPGQHTPSSPSDYDFSSPQLLKWTENCRNKGHILRLTDTETFGPHPMEIYWS